MPRRESPPITRSDEERELQRVLGEGDLHLGELLVRRVGTDYEILGPGVQDNAVDAPGDPEALRTWIRSDSRGRYRPLCGATGMRTNWTWSHRALPVLLDALNAVYPLAWRHRCLHQQGALRVTAAADALQRQSGKYERAGELDGDSLAAAVSSLCDGCIRTPVWHAEEVGPEVPCPEPCSVFVALAREAAAWATDPVTPTADDPEAPFAAFDRPGNAIRNAYLRVRERTER